MNADSLLYPVCHLLSNLHRVLAHTPNHQTIFTSFFIRYNVYVYIKEDRMDKVLSARVDESIIKKLNMLSRQLNLTKKAILEGAILLYAEQIAAENKIDILDLTFGSWKRDEAVSDTVKRARKAFQTSMER
jgi:uncharacterized 2Fe-2S/4Fe-4S cluster protein (DUF4445 family)